jgi:hypothetical protein
MSDLPAESLGYQAVVAEFFLGLKGSGLLLSPLDEELVAAWERRGLPVAVVCRGIRRGLDELSQDRRGPLRSLRAVRFAVEDEWRAYRSGRVGDAPAPPEEEELAARRLAEARERLARAAACGGPLREAYREAGRSLLELDGAARPEPVEGRAGDRLDAVLAEVDRRLLSAWLASLPRPERAALGPRVRLLAGARRPGESRRAYRNSLRAHLIDLAAQAGLTWVGGSV